MIMRGIIPHTNETNEGCEFVPLVLFISMISSFLYVGTQ